MKENKLENFGNTITSFLEKMSDKEFAKVAISNFLSLYPSYFKRLANNNETTEEKMENRTEEIYEPIDITNRSMFMPKSPEVKPYDLSEHGKLQSS